LWERASDHSVVVTVEPPGLIFRAPDRGRMDKTVLVTGSSSGIGRATAYEFLAEDWTVYATARNPADVETLGEEGCRIATLDVTDDGDVERVVDRMIDEEGRIDALVNNAGYGQYGPVEDVPTEAVHRQFDVNVYGPHRLARAVLPRMRSQRDGTIVNVSSVAGRVSYPGAGVYCASKHAMEALSDALRNEVDDYGVDVVLIEPGPVRTGFQETAADSLASEDDDGTDLPGVERSGAYDEIYDAVDDGTTIGGLGAVDPELIAEFVVNAASATRPRARYQPGTVARVGVLARLLPDRLLDASYEIFRKLS
jgi:NAD(P)-dependent dehydrogenase (short-subunit alcohol dehydrogenase family)